MRANTNTRSYLERKTLGDFFSKRFVVFISILILRVVLDGLYSQVISPMYSYAGLTSDFELLRFIASLVMLAIFSYLVFCLMDDERPGAIIICILIVCSAVPTTTIVTYFDVSFEFIILNILYWIFMVAFYKKKSSIIFFARIKLQKSDFLLNIVFVCFGLVIILICLLYSGFNISFNLLNVYETRAAFDTYNIPSILTYAYSASIMVFPIIFIYSMKKKRKAFAILAILFQLLAFAADGRKSTLFVMIATILGYFFLKSFNAKTIPTILAGLSIVGWAECNLLKTDFIVNLVIRRLFILPAYLHVAYYDFFNGNEKDFFRQSILGRLGFHSPYTEKITNLVGARFYINSYANNGLFSDAYANLGVLGVIILPIMIAMVFKLLDRCSDGLPSKLCIGIILVSAYTFLSSSFFVVLLTHGFLLGCIIIYLIPNRTILNNE